MTAHDSLAGRAARTLAHLAEAAATPLVPADYLDLVAPLRPGSRRARVQAIRAQTSTATTLVLRPAGRWPGHRAGQHVRLGVEVDGVSHWRSYSLTSPTASDGTITVTVSAHPQGAVSNHLVYRAKVGDIVGLEGPDGDFIMTSPLPDKVLFVCAGSGITPVMGLLRESLDTLPDVVLVHSARTRDAVLFGDELRLWAAEGRLRLVEWITSDQRRLDADELERLVPDLAERETWVCGPNGLVDDVAARYDARGWSDRLHVERFRPVRVAVGQGGSVTFIRHGVTVESDAAGSLLDTGEGSGVMLPSGCRMGICYGCVVPLIEGSVRDVRNGSLTSADDGDAVLIQTCINTAAGSCRIDA